MLQRIRKVAAGVAAAAVLIGGLWFGAARFDNPATHIVGHHQAGTEWTNPEQAIRWFKSIGNSGEGRQAIAYTVLITSKGEIWKGRDEEYISAANRGLNTKTVSFCWLGDLDKRPPTDAQLVAAGLWVRTALKRHPGAKLIGHKDVAKVARMPSVATGCPGKEAIRTNALRTVFLIASGYSLQEAKARSAAGR